MFGELGILRTLAKYALPNLRKLYSRFLFMCQSDRRRKASLSKNDFFTSNGRTSLRSDCRFTRCPTKTPRIRRSSFAYFGAIEGEKTGDGEGLGVDIVNMGWNGQFFYNKLTSNSNLGKTAPPNSFSSKPCTSSKTTISSLSSFFFN